MQPSDRHGSGWLEDLAKTMIRTMNRLKTTKKQMAATIHSRSTSGCSLSIPASAITVGSVVITSENLDDVYSCTYSNI